MNTNETIGLAIFAVVILIATWQWAFAYGRHIGTRSERQLADRRVNGVLDYENRRKPKSQKNKRKQVRRGKLVGTVVARGVSLPV